MPPEGIRWHGMGHAEVGDALSLSDIKLDIAEVASTTDVDTVWSLMTSTPPTEIAPGGDGGLAPRLGGKGGGVR